MRGCCVVQVVSEEDNTNLLFKPGSLEHWTPDPGNTEALERAKCTVVRDVDGLYGPLNYRTAARTLFLRPYLANFCSFFRRFFSLFPPSWRQESGKRHQKTGGRLRNGRNRPRKEWSPPTHS